MDEKEWQPKAEMLVSICCAAVNTGQDATMTEGLKCLLVVIRFYEGIMAPRSDTV